MTKTEFEQQLTARLHALAAIAPEEPQPLRGHDDGTVVEATTRPVTPPSTSRWLAAAAAGVVFAGGAAFLVRQPSATDITVNPVPVIEDAATSQPLYALPESLDEYQLIEFDRSLLPMGDVGSVTVVGRDTPGEFADVSTIALVEQPSFAGTQADGIIGGQQVQVEDYTDPSPNPAFAVPTDDGRWLEFRPARIELREALLAAVSVIDGDLVFEPFDGIDVLARTDRIEDAKVRTVSLAPDTASDAFVAIITLSHPGNADAFRFSSGGYERVEVQGREALLGRNVDPNGVESNVLSWIESPGHVITVAASVDVDIVDIAEGLRIIDEATWVAELETLDVYAPSDSSLPLEDPIIPDGGILITPAGPHVDGQTVELLAASSPTIDLFNSWLRLCASLDDREEICDPTWIRPRPISDPPQGTQGVTIELPRTHFGPTGERDCADVDVVCRLVWRTEADTLLTSEPLTFTGPAPIADVTIQAVATDQPGQLALTTSGVDGSATAVQVLSVAQLDSIADSVGLQSDFEPENLDITWRIGGLCGFGPGTPPIGSETLEDPPTWWTPTALDPATDSGAWSFFGSTCDSLTPGVDIDDEADTPFVLGLTRNIYGYGGWIDCAENACWLELNLGWTYPMPDGSTLGGDIPAARALVDIPTSWPTKRPSITIVEPGPYTAGQQVTVEVRNHPLETSGLAIGWCPGGDGFCGYEFSTYDNGIHRVTWRIPTNADECGTSRCYFDIGSPSEGLAPPAIVIVPITDN